MSLNAALASAGNSLGIFSTGIQVAGQNISNANTPGYVRERLDLSVSPSIRKGGLTFGTGSIANGIQQEISLFLESRIHSANTEFQTATTRNTIFKQLEAEIRELGGGDLSSALNNFLGAIQEVANQPESGAIRQIAVGQGQQLARDIVSLRTRVDEVRKSKSGEVDALVKEANELIKIIDTLNPQIVRLEDGGLSNSDAGGQRTQRYAAMNRLSEILPVRFVEHDSGMVDVYTGSDYLILDSEMQQLEVTKSVDRGITVSSVTLTETKLDVTRLGGELRGVAEGRDDILGGFVDQLDIFASTLIKGFNEIHTSGEGVSGFESVTSTFQVNDITATLDAAGLAFPPTHGSFEIKLTNKITGITSTTEIAIDLDGIGGNDTTLDDLRAAIGAIADVNATITADRRLKIDAEANFEITFADDSSGILSALGINTYFTGADSSDIGVNQAVVENQELFATSQGGGPADGSNAVLLTQFSDAKRPELNGVTLDDFYDGTIATLAQASFSESAIADGLGGFRDSLISQRHQYSGVSLDEEAIHILEFQQSYQAAARIISTVDELFNVLLSI